MKNANKEGLSQQYALIFLFKVQYLFAKNPIMPKVVTGRMLMLEDETYFLLSPNIKHFLMH